MSGIVSIKDTALDHNYLVTPGELAADRILSLPVMTADGEMTVNNATQTLTNKTLTTPAITAGSFKYTISPAAIAADRTITLPLLTAGDTLVAEAHTQTLTNKTLTSPVLTTPQINDASSDHQFVFAGSELAADRTVTLPALTGGDTFVFEAHTQTLSNKTLTAPQINDTSSDHQYIVGVSELAADRTITLPLLTGNDTFVFESHTQNLSNKTFTDNEVSFTGTGAINIPDGTTAQRPGSPATGALRFNSDLTKFEGYNGTGWGEIGGGGSGGINYIENPDAETNTDGWTDSGAEISITRVTTGTLLRGDASFEIATTASATTSDYVEYQFTLDEADANKVLSLSFDVADGATNAYATGDFDVVVVKDPAGTPVEIVPQTTEIPHTDGVYNFATTWVSQGADTYALRFKVATGSTALDMRIDNVRVGPQELTYGVPMQEFDQVSLSASNFSNATGLTITGYLSAQRIGSNLHLTINAQFTGTGSSGSALLLNLSSVLGSITIPTGQYGEGVLRVDNATATSRSPNVALINGNGTSSIGFTADVSNSTLNGNAYGSTGSLYDFIQISAIIPVNEWAGSSVWLSSAKAEYAYNTDTTTSDNTSAFAYGPTGQAFGSFTSTTSGFTSKRVRFLTARQATDKVELEVHTQTNGWVPAQNVYPYHNTAGVVYGMAVIPVSGSTTDYDVIFGKRGCIASNATFAGNGDAWSTTTANKWRVVKYPGVIQSAQPNAIKWQRKNLTADSTGDGELTDLTFTLEAGKTYRVMAKFSIFVDDDDTDLSIEIQDGATVISRIDHNHSGQTDPLSSILEYTQTFVFTAANGDLSFNKSGFAGTGTSSAVRGVANGSESYVVVEELPYHVEYSGW
jgi:hypothetical protein